MTSEGYGCHSLDYPLKRTPIVCVTMPCYRVLEWVAANGRDLATKGSGAIFGGRWLAIWKQLSRIRGWRQALWCTRDRGETFRVARAAWRGATSPISLIRTVFPSGKVTINCRSPPIART